MKKFRTKLAALKKKWGCQISVNAAKGPEILGLMKKSGCLMAVIGFESLSGATLTDIGKRQSFEDTIKFAMKHKFFFAAFNHLLPFPGTPLYGRLQESGRLLYEKWWLKEGYRYGDIPYRPLKMSHEELKDRCAAVRRRFFSPLNIFRRGMASIWRNPSLMINVIFFSQNKALGKEVDRKLNLPVGTGLDGDGAK